LVIGGAIGLDSSGVRKTLQATSSSSTRPTMSGIHGSIEMRLGWREPSSRSAIY
jgi:hypothetical protein